MKKSKQIFVVLTLLSLLLSCADDTLSTTQEEHLEPVALALENHETEEIIAILFDNDALPDSVSRSEVRLVSGGSIEVHVVTFCSINGVLKECEEDHDDHDDHDDHEEHVEEEGAYSLKANLSDSTVASIVVHEQEFEIELTATSQGTTSLEVEIWHGSHADVSDKIFQVIVE